MRFRRLTRTAKIVIGVIVVIGVLTAIPVIPWDRFDGIPDEATVTPAAAAAKGERALSSFAGKYDWQLSNCRERAERSRFGHWRCDVRTIEPPCHGYVLLDVFKEDHGKADIWHVQNRVQRCAPYGLFGADFTPDSDWE